MITPLAVLILVLLVPSPAGQLLADATVCIDDWSTAVPVVREEGLAPVETVTQLAKTRLDGDIVKVTLCKVDERYVYRLLVRSSNGKMAPVIVDAKEPFGR
jgi:uncharacterized membrane protein YkoI